MSNLEIKNESLRTFVVIDILIILLGFLVHYTGVSQSVDNIWSDKLVKRAGSEHIPSDNILFIDIDDVSLDVLADTYGQWPWPRAIYAELLEMFNEHKPKVIIFDILFTDRDIYRPDSDQYFYETLQQMDNVFLPALHLATNQDHIFPLISSYAHLPMDNAPGDANARAHFLLPSAFAEDVWRLGLINYQSDPDGVGRRYPFYYPLDGWKIKSMPLVVAEFLQLRIPDTQAITLNWYAAANFKTRSMAAFFTENSLLPKQVKDKIVIIGSSASGLHDIKATPVSPFYPGPLILATAIDNLQRESYFKTLNWFYYWLLMASAVGVVSLVFYLTQRPLLIGLTSTSLIALSYLVSTIAIKELWLLQINSNAILIFIHLFLVLLVIHRRSQKQLLETVSTFTRFMDERVVKQLLSEDEEVDLSKPQCSKTTVLFSDIRNFTTLSEKRTPVEIVNVLNNFFDRQVKILFKYGGTLDKFIGDAIMAFWGAPLPVADQERRAIEAALEMIEEAKKFGEEYGIEDFAIGVGIHTGDAVIGAIGSSQRSDYTAIGDTVNLASRIEGLTKEHGRILVSLEAMKNCEKLFHFTPKGTFSVKGREEKVELFEPQRLS